VTRVRRLRGDLSVDAYFAHIDGDVVGFEQLVM
jgi:hypothetical protein